MHFSPFPQSQYKIVSALNEDMVLDCMSDNDNQIVIWKWHEGANQRWHIEKIQYNKFRFTNAMNSKVLTAYSGANNGGMEVKCRLSSKIEQQIWEINPIYDEQYKQKFVFSLRSCSGRVMDVCEGKAKNGQRIIQWDDKKTGKIKQRLNQVWILEPVSFIFERKATYKMFTALDYQMVMDVSKIPNKLNEIILYQSHKDDNQKFYLQSWQGKYIFASKENNFSLQISQGSSQNQASLVAGPMKRESHQLWDIVPCKNTDQNAKGAFYIRSHCGKFLDITNGQALGMAKVFQWDYHGNKNQQWFIQKI